MSTRQVKTLGQIIARAEAALLNNRYTLGKKVLSSALLSTITVTGSASAPNTTTGHYTRLYDPYTMSDPAKQPWQFYGGERATGSSWGIYLNSFLWDIGSTPKVKKPSQYMVEFWVDAQAPVIVLERNVNAYRILVEEDGVMKAIDNTGLGSALVTGGSAGDKAYYTVDFGTRAHRRMAIEAYAQNENSNDADAGRFGGVYVLDSEQIFQPAREGFRAFAMTDSSGQPRNSSYGDGHLNVAFATLGFKDFWNGAIGGTGALTRVWPDTPSKGQASGYYADRRQDVIDAAPDVVLIHTSWNDHWSWETSPTDTVNAMVAEINAYRDALPDVVILVHGYDESAEYAIDLAPKIENLNAAVKAAVDVLDDKAIIFIDPNAQYEQSLTGKLAIDNSSVPMGNYDVMDVGHYSPYGNLHIGQMLGVQILQALKAAYLDIPFDYIPPPVTYGNWTHVVNESDSPNTFTVTASSGVAYRFGNASLDLWSPDTFLSPGTYPADWRTWSTDPAPGHAKEVQIGTPV